jgi:hypothetical protein
LIVWVIAGLLGLATGLRIGWALVNKQSLVSCAMILALGSLGLVAALNWQPLTLLIDNVLRWPNISMAFTQVALVGCAAGSCVMITGVGSVLKPPTVRVISVIQYGVAGVIAVISLIAFFAAGKQPQQAPAEYLRRNLTSGGSTVGWLLPVLYVMLALTLVTVAGLRYSNPSRRGRALFVFTTGIALMVVASGFILTWALDVDAPVGVGAATTLLGCAMLMVAMGALLPSVEDWLGARRELRVIEPLLTELGRRHPDIGIGVRPRGPLVFRVAEQMSMISDALYLEATAARAAPGRRDTSALDPLTDGGDLESGGLDGPGVPPAEQARAIARWVYGTRPETTAEERVKFPGPDWLRQPIGYSDREWILEIAESYRDLCTRNRK